MRSTLHHTTVAVALLFALPGAARGGSSSFEAAAKQSAPVQDLASLLLPFVKTCNAEKNEFQKQFCTALNERLKGQHQSKVYRITFTPTEEGPFIATFKPGKEPVVELAVRGCLTCKEPLLEKEGGDISQGKFFVFKMPADVKISRGKLLYDLGDIDVAKYQVKLKAGTDKATYEQDVLPHLRLDLLFRPVAGTTMVGSQHKYGVANFELVGHRVYHKCAGVYGAAPDMQTAFVVDKNDLSCPQNQPKKVVVKPKLPSKLPEKAVKAVMELLSQDLLACYEQFGVGGEAPVDMVIAAETGKVKQVKVVGKLAGTGTGKCVERLVSQIAFPKFAGSDARLQWPFQLER